MINRAGIELIKSFEGYVDHAYKCPAGVWTIGYGRTTGVKPGMTCTKAQAEEWLQQDLLLFETAVRAWSYLYKWNENEVGALTSFTYNCGTGSLNNLLKHGTRSREEIRKAILLYNKDINGKYLAGLARRRKAELELFNTPVEESTPDKDYVTVEDVVRGIWAGDFGTPWSKSDALYQFFQKKVNAYKEDM